MTVQVLAPGALSTLQDLGRYGYQRFGVSACGAMDEWSHRLANIIVGNAENEATLELTLVGPTLLFQRTCLIAICGADLSATINGAIVPMYKPLLVRAGSKLEFGRRVSGARAYLAARGGYAADPVMNSKSTFVRGGFGGFNGRMLKAGDSLSLVETDFSPECWTAEDDCVKVLPFPPIAGLSLVTPQIVRVIEGQQWEAFPHSARDNFVRGEFRITPQSDRMGYRIEGESLKLETPFEMISEAVTFGTIQVPPDGNPIILMSDRPTTGGYPKFAQVARVDLPLLAQMFAPGTIRFIMISLDRAQELYLEREREANRLKQELTTMQTGTIDFRPTEDRQSSNVVPVVPRNVRI